MQAGHLVQGGSTITQQLAKNVFLTPDRTIRRKGQEVLLALWLEHNFTKEQILSLYLNRVYFGAGTYGVDAAAQKYFGKSAAQVTPFEAAMLAGMLKAPSRYNPLIDPKAAAERAKLVLYNMANAGYITAADADKYVAQGLANLRTPPAASGQYFADWVLDQVSSYVNYADRDLVVVTTIDRRPRRGGGGGGELLAGTDAPRMPARRRWSRSRPTARSARWWAAATTAPASSTARPRRCGRRAPPSSSSSISPPSRRG